MMSLVDFDLWCTGVIVLHKYVCTCMATAKVFNPVVKLVLENYPFSCLSQLRNPHFMATAVTVYVCMHGRLF